jgi:hypothetical protein
MLVSIVLYHSKVIRKVLMKLNQEMTERSKKNFKNHEPVEGFNLEPRFSTVDCSPKPEPNRYKGVLFLLSQVVIRPELQ